MVGSTAAEQQGPRVVGFLGLGIMGTAMAANLLKSGKFEKVVVWNRTLSKCEQLVAEGAVAASTPAEVVQQCDITFAMLADPDAALKAALGPGGVVEGVCAGKGYVDMSTVDQATSQEIAAAVAAKGGRFLEVRNQGGLVFVGGQGRGVLYMQIGLCVGVALNQHRA